MHLPRPPNRPRSSRCPPPRRAGPFRAVVPGVEVTIPPDRQEEETFSHARHRRDPARHSRSRVEAQAVARHADACAKWPPQTVFRRDIWCLEFTFKPVRMIWVDVPQASGKMQRKLIWYMVYHVKNTGKHLKPTRQRRRHVRDARRSIARCASFRSSCSKRQEYNKAYLDRIIPVADAGDPAEGRSQSQAAQQRRNQQQADSASAPTWSTTACGAWRPGRTSIRAIDFFSVYVQGLTNAYHWVDPPRASRRAIRRARAACCCKRR